MSRYTWADWLTAFIMAGMILGTIALTLHQGDVW